MEEIDENTSMEDLQKMMAVALVYRVLVCVYEVGQICDRDNVKLTNMRKKYFDERTHSSATLRICKYMLQYVFCDGENLHVNYVVDVYHFVMSGDK